MEKPLLDQQQDSGREEKEEEDDDEEEEESQPEQQQQQRPEEEVKEATLTDGPSEPQPSTQIDESPVPPPQFDPSRRIIRRKSLIKELAATYHQECLSYCQELLELQRKGDEPLVDLKAPEELKKDAMRPPKRLKKR